MRNIILYIDKHSKLLSRAAVFILTTAIIVWMFPREGHFPYEYLKGKPWLHNDLYSTFDFPIRKTTQEVGLEKDSILKEFKPYYNLSNAVAVEQTKRMDKAFRSVWQRFANKQYSAAQDAKVAAFFQKADSSVVNKYLGAVSGALQYVYHKGIIDMSEQLEKASAKDFTLVIIRDNVGEEFEFSDIFTQKTAYEYVIKRVSFGDKTSEQDRIFLYSGFFKVLNINEYILPNLSYNDEASKNVKDELIKKLSYTKGMFLTDKKIIGKGELVNDEKLQLLESLKFEYENRIGHSDKIVYVIIGQILIVGSLILLLMFYVINFRKEVYHNNLKFTFILLLLTIMAAVSAIVIRKELFSLYVIPFALVPIIIRTFYDARLAMFVHTVTILIVGFMAPNSFEFIFLNFTAGAISIIVFTNYYRRSRLFTTAIYVFLSYCFVYFGLFLIQGNPVSQFPVNNLSAFFGNSFLLLLAYPLIYIFEKIFGFLSDIKLMELADTNQPLLRRLNEKAPGTFQHSLQVANLAEEAAYLIGANPILVRVGALYHDIGKVFKPMYFIENQSADRNPHAELTSEESAQIIIDHVFKGIEIARKSKLPEQIIDFIRTHHGNTMVQFFYRTHLKLNPETEVDKSKFTYPGPIPFSKEMALLMMADSVEAASRSLKEINHGSINDLVENIVYYQMINEQFNDSNISYKDMSIVKSVFKRKLLNMYHVRVEYPSQS
jgi:putative nucleotidyltransferase with HDIG domain